MITIIKHGKKTFKTCCSKCGCEFNYDITDVSCSTVYCPDCYAPVHHEDQNPYTRCNKTSVNSELGILGE